MTSPARPTVKPGKLFINNEWRDAADNATFDTTNPATGEVITQLAKGGAADIDTAVMAARQAFEGKEWNTYSASKRGELLWKIGELVMQHADEIAYLETIDNGKPIFESRYVDIPMVANVFKYYAGWATKIHGETIPLSGNSLNYTLREPIGVIGAITPWNFPLLLASWKIAPALAVGNTVVLKPAQLTSLSALKLAEIFVEAGAPAGIFNVVTGTGSIAGQALVDHPQVDKIAFTGSTEIGKQIMRSAAGTIKRISLELGGKSPNIVFDDADIEGAIRGAATAIFYGKGEVCAAGSRLFVSEKVYDNFMPQLVSRVKKMVPGDPLDPKTRLGALVSEQQMNTVLSYIEAGKSENAELLTGGDRSDFGGGKGNFVNPTVFGRVQNTMRIAKEEIFGPVLATIPFNDVDEAIALANDTIFGLAAGVWTRDIKKAHYVARRLKAGTVWVNTYNQYDPAIPFGGYKQSGFGRELGERAL